MSEIEKSRARPTGRLPAFLVLGGTLLSLVGWSFDVQWHADVGPDTFFTLTHLFLYAGSALCGITSLIMVLRTTAAQRAGSAVDATVGGRAIAVFRGRFTAPLGYLVTGSAAAIFLSYGLWDQWWHGLYGFDAQLDSPPHAGLLQGNFFTLLGVLVIFAAARHELWGRIGVIVALAMMVSFVPLIADSMQKLSGLIDLVSVVVGVVAVMTLVTATVLFRRRGAALLVAAALAAIQSVLWLITPWFIRTYADAVDLPMREAVIPFPAMPAWMPMGTVVAALLVEAAWTLIQTRGVSARKAIPAFAAAAAAVLTVLIPLQSAVLFQAPVPGFLETVTFLAPTALVALVVGALAGIAARQIGLMLRLLDTPARMAVTA